MHFLFSVISPNLHMIIIKVHVYTLIYASPPHTHTFKKWTWYSECVYHNVQIAMHIIYFLVRFKKSEIRLIYVKWLADQTHRSAIATGAQYWVLTYTGRLSPPGWRVPRLSLPEILPLTSLCPGISETLRNKSTLPRTNQNFHLQYFCKQLISQFSESQTRFVLFFSKPRGGFSGTLWAQL